MCEQKTVTQVQSNTRIMSEAVEWLWEFKRKLNSTIAPKELFDQGNRRNSTTLQSLQAIFQHFFFNMSFPSFFQVLETISSWKVRQVITMAILDYEWTPHSLKCTLFRVDTITRSYVTVRWINLRSQITSTSFSNATRTNKIIHLFVIAHLTHLQLLQKCLLPFVSFL